MWLRFQIGSNMPLREAQHQDVLHRLLAEVVIDPVDLVLVHDLQQLGVERPCRGEVGAERLFDHEAPPGAVLLHHTGPAELARGWCECGGRGRQIEQAIAAGVLRAFQRIQMLAQAIEGGRVLRIGLDEGDALQQLLGDIVVHGPRRELPQALQQTVAQLVIRLALAGHADDAEFFRQQMLGGQIVERWHHQAMGEVAGDAKNDEGAIFRLALGLRVFCHE